MKSNDRNDAVMLARLTPIRLANPEVRECILVLRTHPQPAQRGFRCWRRRMPPAIRLQFELELLSSGASTPTPMEMRKILFLCSQNKLRSPTAEAVFQSYPGVEVDSAGLNHDAVVPLSVDQLEWADTIIVMENAHRNRLNRRFRAHLAGKRIAVLGIPDEYEYMDADLVRLLKVRCEPYLPSAWPEKKQPSAIRIADPTVTNRPIKAPARRRMG